MDIRVAYLILVLIYLVAASGTLAILARDHRGEWERLGRPALGRSPVAAAKYVIYICTGQHKILRDLRFSYAIYISRILLILCVIGFFYVAAHLPKR
jgi:hypothetical protein